MGERRRLRSLGVRALYQAEVVGEDVEDALKNVLDDSRVSPRGQEYLKYVLERFVEHRATIDGALEAQSQNWSLKRMAATDRNVLRWAATELWFCPEVPRAVVLDEAIELAKDLSGIESGRFVNGILDRLPTDPSQAKLPALSGPRPDVPEEISLGRSARTFEVEAEGTRAPVLPAEVPDAEAPGAVAWPVKKYVRPERPKRPAGPAERRRSARRTEPRREKAGATRGGFKRRGDWHRPTTDRIRGSVEGRSNRRTAAGEAAPAGRPGRTRAGAGYAPRRPARPGERPRFERRAGAARTGAPRPPRPPRPGGPRPPRPGSPRPPRPGGGRPPRPGGPRPGAPRSRFKPREGQPHRSQQSPTGRPVRSGPRPARSSQRPAGRPPKSGGAPRRRGPGRGGRT